MTEYEGGAWGSEIMAAAAKAIDNRPDLADDIRAQIRVLVEYADGPATKQPPAVDDAMIRLRDLLEQAGVRVPQGPPPH